MLKKIARRSALLLAFTLLVAPVTKAYADDDPVITGGDPQPTGEPRPKVMHIYLPLILTVLSLA